MGGAAAELFVTHGAVSRPIRLLADQMGVILLDRNAQSSQPTDEGVRLAGRLATGFRLIQASIEQLRPGPLVLSCSASSMRYWLLPRIGRFHDKPPEVEIGGVAGPDPGLRFCRRCAQGLEPLLLSDDPGGRLRSWCGHGVAMVPPMLVQDDLHPGKPVVPFGFVPSHRKLLLWIAPRLGGRSDVDALATWLPDGMRTAGGAAQAAHGRPAAGLAASARISGPGHFCLRTRSISA